ncbi:MAG: hypothetical protein LVR00_02410 [Rhabdochlamydiaceae bacterium]|jgi:hypothetical protein
MHKIKTLLTIAVFGATSLLHGVEPSPDLSNPKIADLEYPPSTEADTPEETYPIEATDSTQDTPKNVGAASEDGLASANNRAWVKFAIAAAAVTVAVVALILVSSNKGKKS